MPISQHEAACLWDMIRAIDRIQSFTENNDLNDYLASNLLQSAVERQLEILGEAANRLTKEFQSVYPEINWRKIIGLRNILIHRYDDIQAETVWLILVNDLHSLRENLTKLLPPLIDP